MKILELEQERLLRKYNEFEIEYINNICLKCIGTVKQRERECGKLNGFNNLGCENMTKSITNKMQEANRVLIEMIIKSKLK